MAYRPSWQGHLKLSLVTCPVALYTATNSGGDVHFNLINPKTNNRIKMITTDPDTGPIERSELVKGYEVSKGEYILLTDEEIKSVKLESTKTIDIERFVPGGRDRPHLLGQPLLPRPGRQARPGGFRRYPHRVGKVRPDRPWADRHGHARADPRARASRQGNPRLLFADGR